MKTQVVVISGKQGSGKTTLVKRFEQMFHDESRNTIVAEVRFAAPLYEMHNHCRDFMRKLGVNVAEKDGRLLQLLGTEWGRQVLGNDVWVKAARNLVNQMSHSFQKPEQGRLIVFVSDCRFINEFEAFPEALRVRLECAKAIRKDRADGWRDADQHPSEISLDEYVTDGRFDMIFNTQHADPGHMATLIAAQLEKDVWLQKRPAVMR